ncbi:hypothetical protein [Reyranella sp. CPCC 100927]|uniref:hypothetical protein n=1 Tax=Reyranella sp. CPCC 100927 TaxID=2599616 RepID=UPI0011B722E3|nr:hypothetical protein [Reyranella sp. CPCC 100927]TWT10914.1 hypothetical protein FQU96_17625 [Reyranella sp. CPCC 100927]
MHRLALVIAALLALLGCAEPTAPSPALGQRTNPTFVRQVAGPDTYLGQMPTSVVLLKSGNPARDAAFCREFVRLQTAQAALTQSPLAPNVILTRWPVRVAPGDAVRPDDCTYLTDSYDFARAARLMGEIRLSSGSFNGPGPFLMIIDGPKVIAVDGSTYGDFAPFVDRWQDAVNKMQGQITSRRPSLIGGLLRGMWTLIKGVLLAVFPPAGGAALIIEGIIGDVVCP